MYRMSRTGFSYKCVLDSDIFPSTRFGLGVAEKLVFFLLCRIFSDFFAPFDSNDMLCRPAYIAYSMM